MGRFTNRLLLAVAAVALATAGISGQSAAGIISDPVGDFLPSYVGSQGGDLDVTSIDVTFDGTKFLLKATMAAAIGTTPGALYVWGVDRGQGTSRFPTLAPGVVFDSVIVLQATGAGTVNRMDCWWWLNAPESVGHHNQR